jgi:hypothetical protein
MKEAYANALGQAGLLQPAVVGWRTGVAPAAAMRLT